MSLRTERQPHLPDLTPYMDISWDSLFSVEVPEEPIVDWAPGTVVHQNELRPCGAPVIESQAALALWQPAAHHADSCRGSRLVRSQSAPSAQWQQVEEKQICIAQARSSVEVDRVSNQLPGPFEEPFPDLSEITSLLAATCAEDASQTSCAQQSRLRSILETRDTSSSSGFETEQPSSAAEPDQERKKQKQQRPKRPDSRNDEEEQRERKHKAEGVCETCGKTYTTRYSLAVHARTHTGEKPHVCAQCGKRFSQRRNYRYHVSLHAGTREFAVECPECGKVFGDRGYLSSHLKIHRDRREYECADCGRRFNQRASYNMHARTHSGEKPHRCNVCDKAFSRKVLLSQHMRTHTGEKPFKCKACGKCFSDRSNLALHVRTHLGIRPFQCSACNKTFTKKDHLRAHHASCQAR